MALGLSVATIEAAPFTYQGRLVDNATPANGSYELRFRLYDAVTAGAQVGSDVTLAPWV